VRNALSIPLEDLTIVEKFFSKSGTIGRVRAAGLFRRRAKSVSPRTHCSTGLSPQEDFFQNNHGLTAATD